MTVLAKTNDESEIELLVYTHHEEMEKYWVIKGGTQVFHVPYDSIFYDGIVMNGKDFPMEYDMHNISDHNGFKTYEEFKKYIDEYIKDEYNEGTRERGDIDYGNI